MFERWGRVVAGARWWVLAAGLALVIAGATWGTGVFGSLSAGGFNDTHTASNKVRQQITAQLGPQEYDVVALYSSPGATVDDPAFRQAVVDALSAASRRPEVVSVVSAYGGPAPTLVSRDRHATYALVRLAPGSDDTKIKEYRAVRDVLVAGHGVTTQFGGTQPFLSDANDTSARDIQRAETLSTPVLLVLLVLIFGSVVAALWPLLIGGVAIFGAFIVTRLLTYVTDVSVFAINIITLIGLGLSIDYALFIVSRFREELAAGYDKRTAVARTMTTAGRTVAVSGLTVTLALASLLLFPQPFLKSMAYGGMAAVAVAMLAALTILPAGLAVLGHRINALHIPLPGARRPRSLSERPPVGVPHSRATAVAAGRGGWARLARSVMRRPWLYLVGVLLVLAVLATPVTRITFGGADTRVLPTTTQSRIVDDRLAHEFPATSTYPIQVLATGVDRAGVAALAGRIGALPHVTGVSVVAGNGTAALLRVAYTGEPTGTDARAVVRDLRALTPPPGATIGVTGYTADLLDQLHRLGGKLPWMALFVVVVTFVLLFLAFGSVVLPLKAIVLNIVSLGAAFGAVVFIFQEGHFASWLGFTPTGFIEPTNPILMVAVLFGLATDYEVFLLSRIREEWDRGADNPTAVATGLQRTGPIITSAALLLIVVVIGFAAGGTAFLKLIGIGMVAAILVDATLVRALLVPAAMRLLGRWNWWAPGPLGRLYRRYGIRESAAPEPVRDLEPVG
jgi:trehalose monomycolate/heme transporter